jgi:simple sugar transport system ATP-binding protein
MVHQQSLLLTRLTVAENVLLSSRDRRPVRRRQVEDALDRLAEEHVIPVDSRAKVSQLSGAARQRAELLIALYHQATIIILDEPTTILTPQEVEQLLATLRRLKEAGRTMLFVTHKLNEVMAISDTVTIMRRGAVVRTCATRATTTEELTVAILGLHRDQASDRDKSDQAAASLVLGTGNGADRAPSEAAKAASDGPELLRADDRVVRGASGVAQVDSVSLSMRQGEILAITGIEGNGQRELAETVVGVRHSESGSLRLSGAEITRANIRRRRDLGLGYVPEDRVGVGICADLSVADNVAAGTHRTANLCRHGLRNRAGWAELAATVVSKYRVACGSTSDPISSLSGGNAQKIVLGREVERDPALLVAIQPTPSKSAQGWDLAFATNHVGPFAFTEALIPHLGNGTNVVFTASAVEDSERKIAVTAASAARATSRPRRAPAANGSPAARPTQAPTRTPPPSRAISPPSSPSPGRSRSRPRPRPHNRRRTTGTPRPGRPPAPLTDRAATGHVFR